MPQAVETYDSEMRARLLQFVTGTSKVPMNGFSELQGLCLRVCMCVGDATIIANREPGTSKVLHQEVRHTQLPAQGTHLVSVTAPATYTVSCMAPSLPPTASTELTSLPTQATTN